jgi:hypothetical protein
MDEGSAVALPVEVDESAKVDAYPCLCRAFAEALLRDLFFAFCSNSFPTGGADMRDGWCVIDPLTQGDTNVMVR